MQFTQRQTDNFWKNIKKSDGCWEWQGARVSGKYGRVCVTSSGKQHYLLAHRVSYMLTYGVIPEHDSYHGICVMHKCDNPCCVNPKHLLLGTQLENMQDSKNKGRKYYGENRGENSGRCTITELKASQIKDALQAQGNKLTKIAKTFSVGKNIVANIAYDKAWGHLVTNNK